MAKTLFHIEGFSDYAASGVIREKAIMADGIADAAQNIDEPEAQVQEDMDLVTGFPGESIATESAAVLPDIADKASENGGVKRGREDEEVENRGFVGQ